MIAAAAILLAASLVGGLWAGSGPAVGSGRLFADPACGALGDYMRAAELPEEPAPTLLGAASPVRGALVATAPAEPEPAASDGSVQEYGITQVDGDRVLTYGGKVHDGLLRVLRPSGRKLEVLGTLKVEGISQPRLLVLPGDKVLVLGGTPVPDPDTDVTDLVLVDLADPAHPVVLRTDRVWGWLRAAYAHGDVVRAVFDTRGVRHSPRLPGETDAQARERNREMVRQASGEAWLPRHQVLDGTGQVVSDGPLLGCSDVVLPERPGGYGITSVLTLGGSATGPAATGIATSGQTFYATAERLYVGSPETTLRTGTGVRRGTTAVHAFDLTERGGSPYVGAGTVPGLVSGGDAYSFRDGRLRVVLGSRHGSAESGAPRETDRHGVAVLVEDGSTLRTVGVVRSDGAEGVRAVTWLGDLAVAYEGHDRAPRAFVVDVADPAKPRITERVALPAWAHTLQAVGGRTFLGAGDMSIGPEPEVEIGFLDFTDPSHPRRVSTARVGVATGVPAALGTFAWFPERRLAVVPASASERVSRYTSRSRDYAVGVRMDAKGRLRAIGRFETHDYMRRIVLLGDRVVYIGDGSVTLADATTMRALDRIVTSYFAAGGMKK